jgi:DNA-binding NtrC family response regulator
MTTAHPLKVLIVDDDLSIRTSFGDALGETMQLEFAASGEEALAVLQRFSPDVILSDVRMPGMSGLELLKILRDQGGIPDVAVILMTAYDDMDTVVTAMREGATEFLVKPITLHDLRAVLRRVDDDRQLRDRAERTADVTAQSDICTLIGRDPRMIEVFKRVGQAAASRAHVLIRGESGTGKELIARAIHFNSETAAEPFIPVNCAAIPSGLLESELFGHVRGAFTGASSNRRGRFALAGTGTIFLDEIGDTTAEFQSKLLRVLEDREIYPVGAERPERTDARVIAATHRDLERLVAEGRFRADVYYRLDVLVITLPPLRERLGDIPLLAQHFIRRSSPVSAKSSGSILSPEALEVLRTRQWPGNVRELENALTRAVILAGGDVIRPEHLAPPLEASNASDLATLAELERQHVVRVLAATHGHKARAAELLGISRPRLDRLLQKYGL